MKHFILAGTIVLVIASGCTKELIEETSTAQPEIQMLTVDPVIEAYSPFGPVERAPSNYTPQLSACSNCIGVYLHTPTYGPYAGFTVEIYRFASEEDISGPCGAEFILTKLTGNDANNNEYVYCDTPSSNCKEEEANGRCMYVFCDK
jgi:hypothetical protein